MSTHAIARRASQAASARSWTRSQCHCPSEVATTNTKSSPKSMRHKWLHAPQTIARTAAYAFDTPPQAIRWPPQHIANVSSASRVSNANFLQWSSWSTRTRISSWKPPISNTNLIWRSRLSPRPNSAYCCIMVRERSSTLPSSCSRAASGSATMWGTRLPQRYSAMPKSMTVCGNKHFIIWQIFW